MTLQYSKKVMKLFMNPKNMGEIKNADGVGKVGNPTCLLSNERIILNNKFIEIEKAEKDNLVISHDCTENKILEKSIRNYKGIIITLKNALGNISITPEHLIYAIKVPKGDRYKRIKGKKELIPSWYHAEDLKKGDVVLYPFSKEEKNIKYLTINIPKLKYDFRSKNLPKKIPVNFELLRLFGYFLSEGNVQDKPTKTYISFSLNIKEIDIVEDIRSITKDLFNLEVKTKERSAENGVVVYIYNAQLARFFKKLFNNGAKNKFLPEFIMNLPIRKQKSLIEGLWKGDGYFNLKRNGPRAGYSTISYQLAQQIKVLLLRQGIVSSIYLDKEKTSKGVHHEKAYRIHVGQRESLIKLCELLNIKYSPKSYPSISSWFNKDILYTPITKIEDKNYKGKVYNLEVDGTHSFVSESFCLHNCGDVMWVYIKVAKDKKKKGKEYIKDIKFKTFGCASAIATSSMITQIAKGKTLEEAEKIKYKDVVDSLGGLPSIKIHCSTLATEALNSAIENYRKKKKNKNREEKEK
jgi:nitrogen fixation protein NifU and related proteins